MRACVCACAHHCAVRKAREIERERDAEMKERGVKNQCSKNFKDKESGRDGEICRETKEKDKESEPEGTQLAAASSVCIGKVAF